MDCKIAFVNNVSNFLWPNTISKYRCKLCYIVLNDLSASNMHSEIESV